jgi:hypothetical protein
LGLASLNAIRLHPEVAIVAGTERPKLKAARQMLERRRFVERDLKS